ncbi:ubiquinone biosynthesis protein COQ9, mitochondrial-like isoform X1 [Apostichopus japonicus]|uniref:ubiquinone biosynthesis protein COQ9, mitochondrial-like isoform X1 n=1 Tax=Stichopus japonicus TaxID=307972 RepID=UPI003AB2D318
MAHIPRMETVTALASIRKLLASYYPCFSRSLSTSRPFLSESDHSSHDKHEEEEMVTEEELKSSILDSALNFVPSHGWSVKAIAKGAQQHGYPGVTHGLFPRGGGDLMHHFVRQCNNDISKHLEGLSKDTDKSRNSSELSPSILRDAFQMRLRMLVPYMDHWPQAMALTALPTNIQEHFTNLYKLIDDICYHSGDRSVDFSWYTRRLALLGVYKSCELHIVQDGSHDYQETWDFLDRRLDDFTTAGKVKEDIDRFTNPEFFSAVYTVGRNILGVNDQRR